MLAKIVRVYQHRDALEQAIDRFAHGRPHSVAFDEDIDPDYVRFRLVVRPPPPEVAVLTGDLVQSLRAALDYLAWQLVIDCGDTPSDGTTKGERVTQFPIFTKAPRDSRGNEVEARIFPRVSDDAHAFLQVMQPYNLVRDDPEGDPRRTALGALAELSNADKHRTLHATVPHLQGAELVYRVDGEEIPITLLRGNLKDGTHLKRVRKDSIPSGNTVEMKLTGAPVIAIEIPGGVLPVLPNEPHSIFVLPEIIIAGAITPLIGTFTRL